MKIIYFTEKGHAYHFFGTNVQEHVSTDTTGRSRTNRFDKKKCTYKISKKYLKWTQIYQGFFFNFHHSVFFK